MRGILECWTDWIGRADQQIKLERAAERDECRRKTRPKKKQKLARGRETHDLFEIVGNFEQCTTSSFTRAIRGVGKMRSKIE